MTSSQLAERLQLHCRTVTGSIRIASFSAGMLIGVLLVSTALTWTLTCSDDRSFACAAILMLACGVVTGRRYPLSHRLSPAELAIAAGLWTLVQPWLLSALTVAFRYVPLAMLASEFGRLLVGAAIAIPVWFVSGVLWSSLVAGLQERSESQGKADSAPGWLACGIASGLCFGGVLAGPIMGTWGTVVCAIVAVLGGRIAAGLGRSPAGETSPTAVSTPVADQSRSFKISSMSIAAIAAVGIGGLLAVVMRLSGQLIPNGFQVSIGQWMGLALGLGLGQSWLAWRIRPAWFVLIPAAAGALLLAALPAFAGTLLWSNATLTSRILLLAVRVCVLIVATAPLGFAMAGFNRIAARQSGGACVVPPGWIAGWPAAAIGFVAVQFSFEAISPAGLLAAWCIALVGTGLATLIVGMRQRPGWLEFCGIGCLAVSGASAPLWQRHDNAPEIARLLFSTPSFVAYRAGWETPLLPVLDDARIVDVRQGLRGPLTLWRSRGLELHLRDGGIPRAAISADTRSHPQFAPEVLQAVIPLVLARQSQQVLLLGASGGVPLATCLQFPVYEVTCAESDRPVLGVIRGPLAREVGADPFADSRVRLLAVPPALALMGHARKYDVILSSPPSSSIVAGGAMFTVEHYRNASRSLAEGGVFCQRFEGVDYGPDPLRIVVRSMQQAFRQVIAVEAAAGSFLLLGTNSSDVFVPEDLAVRLRAPQVCRLLARSGLDWSTLLNLPAYDHAALEEICAEGRAWQNTSANGLLALRAPLEVMRWGAKLNEVQSVLTAPRSSPAPFLDRDDTGNPDAGDVRLTRKSRLLEWLGDRRVSPDVLRRLSEVATQYKLVDENPDSHWWQYRKALRQHLQNRSREEIQQVSLSTDQRRLEDERRKEYFEALGAAARQPTPQHIDAVSDLLQPYDPLVSYFGRQEVADLQEKGQVDPAAELMNRLHVIYFAPAPDASTRNIASAIELLVRHPEAVPDPARRFDILNGLVQTLRIRWELRAGRALSPRRQMADIDRSAAAIGMAVQAMESLHADAGYSDADWESRKQVIDRVLLRPLHSYRSQLRAAATRNEGRLRAAVDPEQPAPGN